MPRFFAQFGFLFCYFILFFSVGKVHFNMMVLEKFWFFSLFFFSLSIALSGYTDCLFIFVLFVSLFFFSLFSIVCVFACRSENGDADLDEPTTCCKLCKCCTPCYASALCLPCRRLKKLSCCNRSKKLVDEQKASEIATSILHESETKAAEAADTCWKRLKCCNRKSKQAPKKIIDEMTTIEEQTMRRAETLANAAETTMAKERGKCALCLAKVFCCRKTNKIQTSGDGNMTGTESDEEAAGCCACLPCRRKKKEPIAWSERRQDSLTSTENIPKKWVRASLDSHHSKFISHFHLFTLSTHSFYLYLPLNFCIFFARLINIFTLCLCTMVWTGAAVLFCAKNWCAARRNRQSKVVAPAWTVRNRVLLQRCHRKIRDRNLMNHLWTIHQSWKRLFPCCPSVWHGSAWFVIV